MSDEAAVEALNGLNPDELLKLLSEKPLDVVPVG